MILRSCLHPKSRTHVLSGSVFLHLFGMPHYLISLFLVARRGSKGSVYYERHFLWGVSLSHVISTTLLIAMPVTSSLNKSWVFADCYPPVLDGCPVSSCMKWYYFVFYTLKPQFLKRDGNSRWVQCCNKGYGFIEVVIGIMEK